MSSAQSNAQTTAPAPRTDTPNREGWAWQVAAPPWVVAHLLAGIALFAVAWSEGINLTGEAPGASGVWVWDGGWYRWIGSEGYNGVPRDGIRFFPLLPMLGHLLGPVLGGVGPALLIVSTIAAWAYLAQLALLVREEVADASVAIRSSWFAAILPGAGVLVLPYTEPIALLLAVGFFRALRRGNLTVVIALGILSGLARPTGVLLAAPAFLELCRTRPSGLTDVVARAGAVASPLIGTGVYMGWVEVYRGEFLAPYSIQTRGGLRGGVATNPLEHLFHSMPFGLKWPLQVFLVVCALALLVVVLRRLPISYGAWSALTIAAAVTTSDGHSMPRYLAGTFPLAIALGLLTVGRPWRSAVAGLVCAVLFTVVAWLGFSTGYVL